LSVFPGFSLGIRAVTVFVEDEKHTPIRRSRLAIELAVSLSTAATSGAKGHPHGFTETDLRCWHHNPSPSVIKNRFDAAPILSKAMPK
jgi:hypothetical protein